MTAQPQNNQTSVTPTESKENSKEINFRLQEKALQEKYERQLAQERQARLEAEKRAQELAKRQMSNDNDDNDDEPYVDHKKLNKKLQTFSASTQSEIQKAVEGAKQAAKEELKQEFWLESNPDFYDVMQNHAEKFAQRAPKLAESILRMPDSFERQKLVYQNIKELGIDKPERKEPTIQEKVDANRRSPFYQPSGVATAPYSSQSDFSEKGQKQAYDKMQELKKTLRLG